MRFRYGDSHKFVDSSLFYVETDVKRDCYEMKVFIPKEVLHGYDLAEFRWFFVIDLLEAMDCFNTFSFASNLVSIEKHPELWASS